MAHHPAEWEIFFYQDHRRKNPVLTFVNGLPTKEQAKVRNMLRLLREFGITLGMPHARHIEGKLWELRSGAIRLFYFVLADRRFVILHGYRKQSAKTPKGEIAIAIQRMEELLEEV